MPSNNPSKPVLVLIASLALLGLGQTVWSQSPSQPSPSQPSAAQLAVKPITQLRGLWVDAFGPGLRTPGEISAMLNDAKALGVNAIFAQISRRFDCYCNKAAMPRTTDPAVPSGFDPLADLIAKAKPLGIQVHGWVITSAIFNDAASAPGPDSVFATHGPNSRDSWVNVRQDGQQKAGKDYIVDLSLPAARDYIVAMYTSLAQNYDLDGLQLDRVRYPDSALASFEAAWGYHPAALARFEHETGRSNPTPNDPLWQNWRREQVTSLVRRIYTSVKAIKPNLWLSAATINYKAGPRNIAEFRLGRTYSEVLQDWPSWMSEGILDLNVPMNYKRDNTPEERAAFDGWNRFAASQKADGAVAIGAAVYLNSSSASQSQLARAISTPGIDGWVGYSYRTPDASVGSNSRAFKPAWNELVAKIRPLWRVPASWKLPAPRSGVSGRLVVARPSVPPASTGQNSVGQVLTGASATTVNASLALVSNQGVVLSWSNGKESGKLSVQSDGGGYYGFVLPKAASVGAASGAPININISLSNGNAVLGTVLSNGSFMVLPDLPL
jgi:uncharacterized lipoprotein YddW (UPF0748 family)